MFADKRKAEEPGVGEPPAKRLHEEQAQQQQPAQQSAQAGQPS